jgi:hypothetical protein
LDLKPAGKLPELPAEKLPEKAAVKLPEKTTVEPMKKTVENIPEETFVKRDKSVKTPDYLFNDFAAFLEPPFEEAPSTTTSAPLQEKTRPLQEKTSIKPELPPAKEEKATAESDKSTRPLSPTRVTIEAETGTGHIPRPLTPGTRVTIEKGDALRPLSPATRITLETEEMQPLSPEEKATIESGGAPTPQKQVTLDTADKPRTSQTQTRTPKKRRRTPQTHPGTRVTLDTEELPAGPLSPETQEVPAASKPPAVEPTAAAVEHKVQESTSPEEAKSQTIQPAAGRRIRPKRSKSPEPEDVPAVKKESPPAVEKPEPQIISEAPGDAKTGDLTKTKPVTETMVETAPYARDQKKAAAFESPFDIVRSWFQPISFPDDRTTARVAHVAPAEGETERAGNVSEKNRERFPLRRRPRASASWWLDTLSDFPSVEADPSSSSSTEEIVQDRPVSQSKIEARPSSLSSKEEVGPSPAKAEEKRAPSLTKTEEARQLSSGRKEEARPPSSIKKEEIRPTSPSIQEGAKPPSPRRQGVEKPPSPRRQGVAKPPSQSMTEVARPPSPRRQGVAKPPSQSMTEVAKPPSPRRQGVAQPPSQSMKEVAKPPSPSVQEVTKPPSPRRQGVTKPPSPSRKVDTKEEKGSVPKDKSEIARAIRETFSLPARPQTAPAKPKATAEKSTEVVEVKQPHEARRRRATPSLVKEADVKPAQQETKETKELKEAEEPPEEDKRWPPWQQKQPPQPDPDPNIVKVYEKLESYYENSNHKLITYFQSDGTAVQRYVPLTEEEIAEQNIKRRNKKQQEIAQKSEKWDNFVKQKRQKYLAEVGLAPAVKEEPVREEKPAESTVDEKVEKPQKPVERVRSPPPLEHVVAGEKLPIKSRKKIKEKWSAQLRPPPKEPKPDIAKPKLTVEIEPKPVEKKKKPKEKLPKKPAEPEKKAIEEPLAPIIPKPLEAALAVDKAERDKATLKR